MTKNQKKSRLQARLEDLRTDFQDLRGTPFKHFHCPILLRDEDVELCEGHIINQSFDNPSNVWTVQRKDVDNFFGSIFEADFEAIKYHDEKSRGRIVSSKHLFDLFKPTIDVDNEPVEYFVPQNDLPLKYSRVEFQDDGGSIELALKISPADLLAKENSNWELHVSKDIRIHALVSLIKAAHLTLFHMLGYRYGLSTGGNYVGRHILGEFFLQNFGGSKRVVIERAAPFFREFAPMFRPVVAKGIDFQGTLSDGKLMLCRTVRDLNWGLVVFISISGALHAVLIPIFDDPESIAYYLDFMKNDHETLRVQYCIFEEGKWNVDPNAINLSWPKTGTLYPES